MVTTKDETYDTINGGNGKGCPFFDNEAWLDSCCRLNVFANRQAFFVRLWGDAGKVCFKEKSNGVKIIYFLHSVAFAYSSSLRHLKKTKSGRCIVPSNRLGYCARRASEQLDS